MQCILPWAENGRKKLGQSEEDGEWEEQYYI